MADGDLFDSTFLARLERLHLAAKHVAERSGAASGMRSRRLGDGLEFADHRAYVPGDDPRFLDWPYYARMERLLIRLFHEHGESDVVLLLDASASMSAGGDERFDYARHLAAALAYVAMGEGNRVRIVPFSDGLGDGFRTARDRRQILPVLGFLREVQAAGPTNLRSAAYELQRRVPRAGTVLVLSDLRDSAAGLDEALPVLRAGGRYVAVLHIHTPNDADPSVVGPVRLRHAEIDRQMDVTVTPDLAAAYRAAWRESLTGLEHTCRSRDVAYVPSDTSTPFPEFILRNLRAAGVVG